MDWIFYNVKPEFVICIECLYYFIEMCCQTFFWVDEYQSRLDFSAELYLNFRFVDLIARTQDIF